MEKMWTGACGWHVARCKQKRDSPFPGLLARCCLATMEPAPLQRLCDDLLCARRFDGLDDPHGMFLPSDRRDVRRLGLALEPWPGLSAWVEAERLDLLFIHRPWRLTEAQRHALAADGVGVLAYHLAFDERLTTGLNPALAAACGWSEPETLGHKDGRPLGMVCGLTEERAFGAEAQRLQEQFGGLEQVAPPAGGPGAIIARVAVVGAMTDALVRAAHAAGAGLYATGQWRQPARAAVRETGIGVVAIGHRRSEEWGLRALARLLRARASVQGVELAAVIAPRDPLA